MLITLHYVPLTSLYNLLAHQQQYPQFSLPYIHNSYYHLQLSFLP